MSFFQTSRQSDNKVFNRNPSVGRNPYGKGWVINARHESDYMGQYVMAVGFADALPDGRIAFRLKRDASAAMGEAIKLGILRL